MRLRAEQMDLGVNGGRIDGWNRIRDFKTAKTGL